MADRELKSVEADIENLYEEFPKLSAGSPMFRYWDFCRMHIERVRELANVWHGLGHQQSPETAYHCGGLFQICAWYLYEVGRYDDALQLLNIAFEATPDTKPAYYVPLCDIAAAIYFEQNDLKSCQEFNEKSQQIRQASFEGLTCKRMFHYQNLGNLAAAQGNCEKALKHYEKSVEKLMDYELQYKEKDMILEIYCMMTGHIYFLDGDDDNAMKRFTEAVKMLERYEHEAAPLYARSLYAIANWKYKNVKEHQNQARKYYTLGREMSLYKFPENTTHILTAMFDYKLGMLEADSNNFDKAMDHLQEALKVARKNKADGHIARILRRQALVIRAKVSYERERTKQASILTSEAKQHFPSQQEQLKEADKLMAEAQDIRARLVYPGAAQEVVKLSEDQAYDHLICPFFR